MKYKRLILCNGNLRFSHLSHENTYVASLLESPIHITTRDHTTLAAKYIIEHTSCPWVVVAPKAIHEYLIQKEGMGIGRINVITYERFTKEPIKDLNHMFLNHESHFRYPASRRSKQLIKLSKKSLKRIILL